MGTSGSRPTVLVVGLDPERVPGPWDPAPVLTAIAAGMAELSEHGIDAVSCLLPLDGSSDPAVVLEAAVRGRAWDCVLLGGGLRSPETPVDLLELVLDRVHRGAPGATLVLGSHPTELWTAVQRGLARR